MYKLKSILSEIKLINSNSLIPYKIKDSRWVLENGWWGLLNDDNNVVFLATWKKNMDELENYFKLKNVKYNVDIFNNGNSKLFLVPSFYFKETEF